MSRKPEISVTPSLASTMHSVLAEIQQRLVKAQAAAPAGQVKEAIDHSVQLAGIHLRKASEKLASDLPQDGAGLLSTERDRAVQGLNVALQLDLLAWSRPSERRQRVADAAALPLERFPAKVEVLRSELRWLRDQVVANPGVAEVARDAAAQVIEEGRYRLAVLDQLCATWCDEAWPSSANADSLAKIREAGGYWSVVWDPDKALYWQDALDNAMNARLVGVSQAVLGEKTYDELRPVCRDGVGFTFPNGEAGHLFVEPKVVGAGRNVVGLTYHVSVGNRTREDSKWVAPVMLSVQDRMVTTAEDMGLYLRREAAGHWARHVESQRLVAEAAEAVQGTMDVVTGWMPSGDDRYAAGFTRALSLLTKELAARGVAPAVLTDALAYTGREESAAQRAHEEEAPEAPHP